METKSLVESLLFVAEHPVAVENLASAIQVGEDEVEQALEALSLEYQERGIRLQRKGGRAQLVSAPEAAPLIGPFLGLEMSRRLSTAALETLGIVAFRQPTTRVQIEAIRGVNSDSVLRSLVRRGLLEEVGREDTAGRPILYGTSFEFLQQFGMQSLRDLPDWQELEVEET